MRHYILFALSLVALACDPLTSSTPLDSNHGRGDDHAKVEFLPRIQPRAWWQTPTATVRPTSTTAPVPTSTPSPVPTSSPAPTATSILPPTVPGATYDPDVFKVISPAVCVFRTAGTYIDVAFIVSGGQGLGGPPADVSARFFTLGGVALAPIGLGTFQQGVGTARVAWDPGVMPTWVALLGTVNGVAYMTDTCSITASPY